MDEKVSLMSNAGNTSISLRKRCSGIRFRTLVVATLALVASSAGPADAGTVTFTGASTFDSLTLVNGSGTLTGTPGTMTDFGTGFTLSDEVITYTSVDSDIGTTVNIQYTASRPINYTPGVFITVINALIYVNVPPAAMVPVGGINVGTMVGSMAGTGVWVNNAVSIPSGTLPFVGTDTSSNFTLSSSASSALSQVGYFSFTPTAAGQVFQFSLPVTSEIRPIPEPAALIILLGLGLTCLANRIRSTCPRIY
jgi:hypothetical protein